MSYSFKEICNFKPDEQYWESSQSGSFQFTVKETPVVTEEDGHNKVRFTGVTNEGEEVSFLVTEGLEHYGPKIYPFKAYMTLEELRGE